MNTRVRTWSKILIVPSAVLGLGAWLVVSRAPSPAHGGKNAPERSALANAPDVPASDPGVPSAREQTRSYALELSNHFAPEGSADEDAAFSLALSATLDVAPLEAGSLNRRLALRDLMIRDGSTGDAADPESVAALQRSLEQPFTLHFDAAGRLQELELGFASDAFAEGLLRVIGAALQFVPAEDAAATEWSARELDAVGEADVQYRKIGARVFSKTKRSYLRVVTDAGLQDAKSAGATVSVNGSTRIERDASGALHSLRLAETVTNRVENLGFQNSATLSLRFTGAARPVAASAARAPARRAGLEQLPARAAVDPQKAERELVGDATFAELKREIADVKDDDVEGRRRARERLEAALELGRGDARELVPVVAGDDATAASIALGALADTETPAAQATLRDLARAEEVQPERRDDALAMLGLSAEPAPETTELAREISEDSEHPSQATATLALGNLARTLGASGDEPGGTVVGELMARLKAAETDEERLLLLGALGNTGAAELPELLAPWLANPAAEVRAAATFALRLCSSDAAFGVLAQKAAADAEAGVRLKAVSAFGYRFAERAVSVLDKVLRQDRDADVRLEALSALASNGSPDVLGLVQWVAENDRDAHVKEQASRLLEAGG